MTQVEDTSRDMRLDPDSFAQGYFKNAVYRHWDPYDIEGLEADKEKVIETAPSEEEFNTLRTAIARFGAGEEAVTEDLMPLGMALEDINDQMFLSSQIYEEAKHTQFFDRYWREVVNPAEEALDFEVTRPTDQRFFNDHYIALFDKTEDAMERLLEDDSPEARVEAYCHYHLVVESVLAQTGYYGFQSAFSDQGSDEVAVKDWPNAEGLVDGVAKIRSDEGRHVGFGMNKVRGYVQNGEVDESVVQETLQDLMPHVAGTFSDLTVGINPAPLVAYSRDKLTRRIEIITDAEAEVPDVDELVKLDTGEGTAAD
ncbi:ferritin family protein [Halorientalis regularis]|uniref:Ribonucleoside-diphosphate reductase beta chain n=1 Tax=Halorientalis regularis TaxID=660518 RepID=A0A1G7SD57_9EURY|nr:ribonucleoside-diphosphate reductase [Halorientalis regularis]SDG20958.1 ribonucleoside-diphosphate reductase beta chain [Halorientalis regularis]